ncbi:3-deoxy-manno-octulosonate cytidylyltransferase [Acetobacter sp. AN02]|nr:3-deoxy-manno-octulosonate cytidylyltransferase [Acetobacter sp. AN02]
MGSSRLPGKPLADIAGRPMILHVAERARVSGVGPVVVAAAEEDIAAVVRHAGYEAVLTAPDLPSGSDRVLEAARIVDPEETHDVIINLQGDLPLLRPRDLYRALLPLQDEAVDIGTLVAPVTSEEEAAAESVVKTACSFGPEDEECARALYFSRNIIPWGQGPLWHHVGIYAWRRTALNRFVSLTPSGLEQREKLEQLRALEAGMTIGCARIADAPLGVDTPADLEHVRRVAEEEGRS